MIYHYVMTVVAPVPGGQQHGMVSSTIDLENTDRETLFWRAFEEACERGNLPRLEANVVFWSLKPNDLD